MRHLAHILVHHPRSMTCLVVAMAIVAICSNARGTEPNSSLHPPIRLRDQSGNPVVDSGQPISAMQSCAPCHDTQYIATHGYHSQVIVQSGEMNCFICHVKQPDDTARRRQFTIGKPQWATTATLAQTQLVARTVDDHGQASWTYDRTAFLPDGAVTAVAIGLTHPTSENCGQCHGRVEKGRTPLANAPSLGQWMTASTGQIFSPQRMSDSAMNLSNKAEMARPWDTHAGAMLECTSCHYSPNNPAAVKGKTVDGPRHLSFDPRRTNLQDYLDRPNHNFARGYTVPVTHDADMIAGADQAGVNRHPHDSMRSCVDCHNAETTHDWLPHRETHFDKLSCQACHIPEAFSPALRQIDRTMLAQDGGVPLAWRGLDGDPQDPTTLVTGFRPALLPARQADGKTRLAPYNIIAQWYWIDAAKTPEPLSDSTLRAALFLPSGDYHPAVMVALDKNGDGQVDPNEIRLDSPKKIAVVRTRLQAVGIEDPRIQGRIEPHALHHGVAPARWATKACEACHSADAPLAASVLLASYLPGNVVPTFAGEDAQRPVAALTRDAQGRLIFTPQPTAMHVYVPGLDRPLWSRLLGNGLLIVVLTGIAVHGSWRVVTGRRRAQVRPVRRPPSNEESNRS